MRVVGARQAATGPFRCCVKPRTPVGATISALVVDDEPARLALLTRGLERSGFTSSGR